MLHLIKLSVGTTDVGDLASWQARRLRDSVESGGGRRLWHTTRNMPRRGEELLGGGSIYWVIKGRVLARQRLNGLERDVDTEGRRFCRLMLDPDLIEVAPWPHRPFQGWRYLEVPPPDLASLGGGAGMPAELAAELRELGLL
jgi:hypothetical protein